MMEESAAVVRVRIYGDEYPIKGNADSAYIKKLADFVDERMRKISDKSAPRDKLKVAVLAAVNIASELFEQREEKGSDSDKMLTKFQLKAEELLVRLEKEL